MFSATVYTTPDHSAHRTYHVGHDGVKDIVTRRSELFINFTDGRQEHYSGFPYITTYTEEEKE